MKNGNRPMKQLLEQENGLSLVELLAALALAGIISIVVMNFFAGGLRSYDVTHTQTTLHNDANYVMTLFSNEIYEAESVKQISDSEILLNEGSKDDREVKLGFSEGKAYTEHGTERNDELSIFYFPPEESVLQLKCFDHEMKEVACGYENAVNKSVVIQFVIEDEEKGLDLELKSEVPIALGHRIIQKESEE